MTKDHLNSITSYLREKVWRNDDIAFCSKDLISDDDIALMIDCISSLHNELYKAVTGEYYDYCWHWTNKIGAGDPEDHMFTEDNELKNKIIMSECEHVKEFCEKWGK